VEEHTQTNIEIQTPLARRIKPVAAREVPNGEVIVHPPQPPPPASPALEPLRDPSAPPAIDPTLALGQRRRKRSHHTRYRLSQLLLLLSLAGSLLALIAIAMEDALLARAAVLLAVLCGLFCIAAVYNKGSDLTSRMAGYGAAATLFASIAAALIFLAPAHWFAERSPEQRQQQLLTPSPSSARNRPK
jgi:hypothetical protein